MVLQWVDLLAQLSVLQWVDLLVSRSDAKKGYLKVQQMVETLGPRMERMWVEMKALLWADWWALWKALKLVVK